MWWNEQQQNEFQKAHVWTEMWPTIEVWEGLTLQRDRNTQVMNKLPKLWLYQLMSNKISNKNPSNQECFAGFNEKVISFSHNKQASKWFLRNLLFFFVFFTAIMVYRNSNRLYNSIKTSCHLPTAMTKFRLLMTNYCYADIYKPRLTLPFKSLGPVRYFYVFKEVLTLLKKRCQEEPKRGFRGDAIEEPFLVPWRTILWKVGAIKNLFWYYKEPFLKVIQRTTDEWPHFLQINILTFIIL